MFDQKNITIKKIIKKIKIPAKKPGLTTLDKDSKKECAVMGDMLMKIVARKNMPIKKQINWLNFFMVNIFIVNNTKIL